MIEISSELLRENECPFLEVLQLQHAALNEWMKEWGFRETLKSDGPVLIIRKEAEVNIEVFTCQRKSGRCSAQRCWNKKAEEEKVVCRCGSRFSLSICGVLMLGGAAKTFRNKRLQERYHLSNRSWTRYPLLRCVEPTLATKPKTRKGALVISLINIRRKHG